MGQTTVANTKLGSGVVGEFYSTEPQGSRSLLLVSASAANNVVGRVVTYVDDESDQAGVAASARFAGIIGMPKTLAREGLGDVTTIANNVAAEIINKGYVFVTLPTVADKGDFVYWTNATGVLTTIAPDGVPPANSTRVPGGKVEIANVTAIGIAVIYVDHGGDISDSTGT